MEQGAALELVDDTVAVIPLNDIYVRYLSDNRSAIAELASELYGRKIKVEMGKAGAAAPALPISSEPPGSTASAGSSITSTPPGENGTDPSVSARTEPGGPSRSSAEARQALYADPVVRRIFNEFEARLVEVRALTPADRSNEDPGTTKR
jgi:hypothetical protein